VFLLRRDCVRALRPKRLVPTVNADSPAKSRAIVDRFADLMDLSGDRSRLDCYLLRRPTVAAVGVEEGQEEEAAVEDDWGDEEGGCAAGAGCPSGSAAAAENAPQLRGCAASAGTPQQQAGAIPAAGAAAVAPARPSLAAAAAEGPDVDLSAIDVAEQQRILAQILASSSSRGGTALASGSGGSSGGGKKRRPPGSGSGPTGSLKQGSLKRFFLPASPPEPPPAPG
jgi:DNA cross-link repair 1A protein